MHQISSHRGRTLAYTGYSVELAEETATTPAKEGVEHGGEAAVAVAAVVRFRVHAPSAPIWVRYTANKQFPQCAVYNQEGLPALPFQLRVKTHLSGSAGA